MRHRLGKKATDTSWRAEEKRRRSSKVITSYLWRGEEKWLIIDGKRSCEEESSEPGEKGRANENQHNEINERHQQRKRHIGKMKAAASKKISIKYQHGDETSAWHGETSKSIRRGKTRGIAATGRRRNVTQRDQHHRRKKKAEISWRSRRRSHLIA